MTTAHTKMYHHLVDASCALQPYSLTALQLSYSLAVILQSSCVTTLQSHYSLIVLQSTSHITVLQSYNHITVLQSNSLTVMLQFAESRDLVILHVHGGGFISQVITAGLKEDLWWGIVWSG